MRNTLARKTDMVLTYGSIEQSEPGKFTFTLYEHFRDEADFLTIEQEVKKPSDFIKTVFDLIAPFA